MGTTKGPRIERIKTEVYFTDATGVEWEVTDARRRRDGRLWKQYAGCDDARYRYFVRYEYRGAFPKIIREIRRYRFRSEDSRWYQADLCQEQLDKAEPREVHCPPGGDSDRSQVG